MDAVANDYGNLGLIFQSRGDLASRANVPEISGDGSISLERNDLEAAEILFQNALELAEQLGRSDAIARAYGKLAEVYRQKREFERAEKMLRKLLQIHERLGRMDAVTQDYFNLGSLYRDRGDVSAATSMWQAALELFKRTGASDWRKLTSTWLDSLTNPR